MPKSRFFYRRSSIYGWAVYDRMYNEPAYMACQDLLPPEKEDESGTICMSPVLLNSEHDAIKLCVRLTRAARISKEV